MSALPLFKAVPVPCPVLVTSIELASITPENSRIAKRKVLPEMLSVTLTVFAPPTMFSA